MFDVDHVTRNNHRNMRSIANSSCIAWYPDLKTVQSDLIYFTNQPVHSNANSTSLGRTRKTPQLLREDYLFIYIYPPRSIARYSFVQLSELRQCGVNKIVQALKQQQEDSNPGALV